MHIHDTAGLAEFAEAARTEGVLAIDTEFMREKTYYPKLCLVQVAAGDLAAIIDPFEVTDLSPLTALLLDTGVVKVLHAATQDMELLTRMCGRPPAPVFDTQVAATLAGFPSQVGYSRLVKDLLGADIDKSDTYTDWARRPLTATQVEYALNDVRYLRPAYDALRARLERDGRLAWLADDFAALSAPGAYEAVPELQYKRIKRASTLSRRQLAVLRSAAAWREREAQRRDLPRRWVLSDEALVEVARRRPADAAALADIRGLNPRSLGDGGRGLLAAVLEGASVAEADLPRLDRRPRAVVDIEGVVELMGALVRVRASEHGIAVPLLATRSDLEHLAAGEDEDSPLLQGWRKALIGEDLRRLLDGKLALRVHDGAVIPEERD